MVDAITPGSVLRKAREKLGLTQVQMAELLGVSQPTVWNWENDRRRPGAGRLSQVAKVYRVDLRRIVPRAA